MKSQKNISKFWSQQKRNMKRTSPKLPQKKFQQFSARRCVANQRTTAVGAPLSMEDPRAGAFHQLLREAAATVQPSFRSVVVVGANKTYSNLNIWTAQGGGGSFQP